MAHSSNKIYLPKEKLEELYLSRKLSTIQIGKLLGCNHVTILNRLKEFGIQRRSNLGTRKPVKVSKEELNSLYHQMKLTQKQIAEKFGHSRWGIQRWMRIYGIKSRSLSEVFTKYPKCDFRGDLVEKAYMIGFRLGDLNVMKVKNLIQARVSSTISAQIEVFKNLFSSYGHVHVRKFIRKKTGEKIIDATYLLNNSFKFLLSKEDKIPNWILEDELDFISFFAGYSDAEGSYFFSKSTKGNKVRSAQFEIQTSQKRIITQSSLEFKKLGVEVYGPRISKIAGYVDRRGRRCNFNIWRFNIVKKEALWKFLNLIENFSKHKLKLEAIKKAKENIILRNSIPYGHKINLEENFSIQGREALPDSSRALLRQ